MSLPPPDIVPGRSCANCTVCCTVLGIPELEKPKGIECAHCDTGRGCTIYARRPEPCADFYCSYLLSPALGDEWKPATAHMVLGYMADADVIIIYTDPAHPGMWRREPYYARVRKWAAITDIGYVLIWENGGALALVNDDTFDLGPLRDDQIIVRSEDPGRQGTTSGKTVRIYAADKAAP
jgi:hypothetical protein